MAIKTKYRKYRYINPKGIAFLNALGISLVAIIVFCLLHFTLGLPLGISLVVMSLAGFLFAFLLTYLWIDSFIYQKIRLLYKVILDFKMSKTTKKEWEKKYRSIEAAEKDAMIFMEKKNAEMEQLRKMENYRKEFLGNVSHELKTPLTTIQGYVLTLLDGGLSDEKINYKYLFRASKNIDRIIAIVDDLEMISKLEYQEFSLHFETVDLYKLLHETIDLFEIQSKKNNVNYVINANVEHSYKVYADKECLQNVFMNLISNAIKYNDKEEKQIKIKFFDMDENYLVEITDNGIGIESESIPRLFERFYRVSKDRSREMGGSGLGLAIVKHIMEAHGQTINVRSTPNIGSTFSFTLKKAN
jgi:two-component system phosphate regulon sensor histidine kinase PhoR